MPGIILLIHTNKIIYLFDDLYVLYIETESLCRLLGEPKTVSVDTPVRSRRVSRVSKEGMKGSFFIKDLRS